MIYFVVIAFRWVVVIENTLNIWIKEMDIEIFMLHNQLSNIIFVEHWLCLPYISRHTVCIQCLL
jgi:hypothetical protein